MASQQQELQVEAPSFVPQTSTHYSIDVECVATGRDHNSRSVAQIALVVRLLAAGPTVLSFTLLVNYSNCLQNQFENVILSVYVKPEEEVVSYLTPLTGLTHEIIQQQGVSFQHALQLLKTALPSSAILVGQNIRQDVQWLRLTEGSDFKELMDLAGIYRAWNTKYNSWSVFGQDHVASVLLNHPVKERHDAVGDAIKSVRLFNLSQQLQQDPAAWQQAQEKLLAIPPQPSFAKKHPAFEGVCMGNRKTCVCGAPFLG